VKIGVLAWDYGVDDPDSPGLAETGRARGHEMVLAPLEEIRYRPTRRGIEVSLGGHPAESFDAVISRANLYGEWRHDLYDGWPDRVERLTMLSRVPGLRMFDPVDAWLTGYSKFLMAQRLLAAGLPGTPLRSASSVDEVAAACAEWGEAVVKPSFGLRAIDVERITDPAAQRPLIDELLAKYGTLACSPLYPTQYGEYRITVAGEVLPINVLKFPPVGAWRCKTLEGASFERFDAPPDLVDLSIKATRAMGLTLAGLDILPTDDGYVILEVNAMPGFLNIFGEGPRQEVLHGVFDWVEKQIANDGATGESVDST